MIFSSPDGVRSIQFAFTIMLTRVSSLKIHVSKLMISCVKFVSKIAVESGKKREKSPIKMKNPLKISDLKGVLGAREEIRTLTPFRALPPQSSASTNFATHAENTEGDF